MYKVVRVVKDMRVSAVSAHISRIIYEKDEWCKVPQFLVDVKKGPFVFKKYKDAHRFLEAINFYNLEIWECEVENPNSPTQWFNLNDLNNGILTPENVLGGFPRGTLECDRIKLTKLVKYVPRDFYV